jgi:hypothetical protein
MFGEAWRVRAAGKKQEPKTTTGQIINTFQTSHTYHRLADLRIAPTGSFCLLRSRTVHLEDVCSLYLSSVTGWDESCRLVYLSRTAAYMRLAG